MRISDAVCDFDSEAIDMVDDALSAAGEMIGEFAAGVVEGVVGSIKGIVNAALHPIDTLNGLIELAKTIAGDAKALLDTLITELSQMTPAEMGSRTACGREPSSSGDYSRLGDVEFISSFPLREAPRFRADDTHADSVSAATLGRDCEGSDRVGMRAGRPSQDSEHDLLVLVGYNARSPAPPRRVDQPVFVQPTRERRGRLLWRTLVVAALICSGHFYLLVPERAERELRWVEWKPVSMDQRPPGFSETPVETPPPLHTKGETLLAGSEGFGLRRHYGDILEGCPKSAVLLPSQQAESMLREMLLEGFQISCAKKAMRALVSLVGTHSDSAICRLLEQEIERMILVLLHEDPSAAETLVEVLNDADSYRAQQVLINVVLRNYSDAYRMTIPDLGPVLREIAVTKPSEPSGKSALLALAFADEADQLRLAVIELTSNHLKPMMHEAIVEALTTWVELVPCEREEAARWVRSWLGAYDLPESPRLPKRYPRKVLRRVNDRLDTVSFP